LRAAPLELRFGRYACLTVKDSGCGMDSATLDRIFEPFFTTKPTGRGMGLAASLGIVRSHQGQIVAKSKPGQGTMMSVLLPAVANDTTPTAAPEEATAQTIGKPLPTGYETILVVDSDPVARHASEQILARQGYCVVTHDSLEHGLAFLDTNAEDIDLVVYGSDTADQAAAKAVSDISERAQHKPIVLMGYPDDAEKIRTSLGGSRPLFEPKPPTPRTLALTVRRAIDDVQSEA
jgi:CheY-like chemotaxis protein